MSNFGLVILCMFVLITPLSAGDQAMIKVIVEGREYSVSKDLVMFSQTIADLINNADEHSLQDQAIPLFRVNTTTFKALFGENGCSGYLDAIRKMKREYFYICDRATRLKIIIARLNDKIEQDHLAADVKIALYKVANYLNIAPLQDALAQQVACHADEHWQVEPEQIEDFWQNLASYLPCGTGLLHTEQRFVLATKNQEMLPVELVHEVAAKIPGNRFNIKKLVGHGSWWERKLRNFEVNAVTVHPSNGDIVISGARDKTIGVWSVEKKQMLQQLKADELMGVNSVAIHPDGNRLISAGSDLTVRVWDLQAGQQLAQCTLEQGNWLCKALPHSDGNRIMVSGPNAVRSFDIRTLEIAHELVGHRQSTSAVLEHPTDSTVIISGSTDSTLRFWDLRTNGLLRSMPQGQWITSMAVHPDKQHLFLGFIDGRLRKMHLNENLDVEWNVNFLDQQEAVRSIAVSSDGNKVLSLKRGVLSCFQEQDFVFSQMYPEQIGVNRFGEVEWHANGKTIIAGSDDSAVWVMDPLRAEERIMHSLREE